MDKLGVAIEEGLDKTASKDKTCPGCGRALNPDSNIPHCTHCGTKPFEIKERKADG